MAGFAGMGTPAPVWPAAAPAAVAQPVTMTATAEKIEPVAYEAPTPAVAEPAPEPMPEPVMEMMPETADLAYEMPAEVASETMAPALQQEMEPSGESFPVRPADNLQRAPLQVQAPIQPPVVQQQTAAPAPACTRQGTARRR